MKTTCPACYMETTVPAGATPETDVTCESCNQKFKLGKVDPTGVGPFPDGGGSLGDLDSLVADENKPAAKPAPAQPQSAADQWAAQMEDVSLELALDKPSPPEPARPSSGPGQPSRPASGPGQPSRPSSHPGDSPADGGPEPAMLLKAPRPEWREKLEGGYEAAADKWSDFSDWVFDRLTDRRVQIGLAVTIVVVIGTLFIRWSIGTKVEGPTYTKEEQEAAAKAAAEKLGLSDVPEAGATVDKAEKEALPSFAAGNDDKPVLPAAAAEAPKDTEPAPTYTVRPLTKKQRKIVARLLVRGKKEFRRRQFERAEMTFEKILEINDTYAFAYRALGDVYARTNRTEKAYEMYQRYLGYDPGARDSEEVRKLMLLYHKR